MDLNKMLARDPVYPARQPLASTLKIPDTQRAGAVAREAAHRAAEFEAGEKARDREGRILVEDESQR